MAETAKTMKTMKTMKDMQSMLAHKSSVMQALAHTGIFRLHLEARATLDSTEVQESVKKPAGVREEEWMAAQVLGILEEVQLTVSLLEDMCTEESCPCMNAGKHFTYAWADEKSKQPVDLPAPRYMERLIAHAADILSDPACVPADGTAFPRDFKPKVSMLVKRFFRVYAHMYLSHFAEIQELGLEAHMNMFLKHLMAFGGEFKLMRREDIAPLSELLEQWNCAMPADRPMMVGAREKRTESLQN